MHVSVKTVGIIKASSWPTSWKSCVALLASHSILLQLSFLHENLLKWNCIIIALTFFSGLVQICLTAKKNCLCLLPKLQHNLADCNPPVTYDCWALHGTLQKQCSLEYFIREAGCLMLYQITAKVSECYLFYYLAFLLPTLELPKQLYELLI